MKTKSRVLVGGTSFLLSLAIAGPAPAQEARKGPLRNVITTFRPPSPQEEKTISTRLQLTEDQKRSMKAVNERYRQDSETLLAKYRAAYDDVVRLMQQTDPNKTAVNDRLKTFHRIHEQVLDKEVGYWMDFKGVLTTEQNRQFWNLFEQDRVRQDAAGN